MRVDIRLGFDLNCFTNRFPEPEEWTRITSEMGIREVQFNADIIDPWLPWKIQRRLIKETLKLCNKRGITISSSFGGHNHHQNYLGHPDREIAKWYENFYERLIHQTALLGARGVGTCYAIMSVRDARKPERKKEILKRASESYIRLSKIARKEGLEYLLYENTSVPRETCATFAEIDCVLSLLKDMAVPMKLCLDVGHRNLEREEMPEASCYEWIKRYGETAPVIHIQQTDRTGSFHWPFTKEYNRKGDVEAEKVVKAIEDSCAREVLLALEIKERAYFPYEHALLRDLKESVRYWRRWVKE